MRTASRVARPVQALLLGSLLLSACRNDLTQPVIATRLLLEGNVVLIAGVPASIKVRATDASGNTITGYRGTHALVFSGASLPLVGDQKPTAAGIPFGTSTNVTFVDGVATVPLVAMRAEAMTLSVSDGRIATNDGDRLLIAVLAGPASATTSIVSVSSAAAEIGTTLSASVLVRDAFGNVVLTADSTSFSASFTPGILNNWSCTAGTCSSSIVLPSRPCTARMYANVGGHAMKGSPADVEALVKIHGIVSTASALSADLRLTMSAASPYQVDYWSDSTEHLRIVGAASAATTTATLYRLRGGQTYHYEVRVIAPDSSLGAPTTGNFTVPALPDDLAQLQFAPTGTMTDGVTLFQVNSAFRGWVGVDTHGQVVWYYRAVGTPSGFAQRANGNFLLNDSGNQVLEVTPAGTVVHAVRPSDYGGIGHHDVIVTPGNSVLFLVQEPRMIGGVRLVGDRVLEWFPETGQVIGRWSVFDNYDPVTEWGERSSFDDWAHANSLAIGPHGNIIISLNWFDQVVSVAPDWSGLEWRIGGVGSDFAVDADALFKGQHSVQMLSETRMLMFDNGRDRFGPGAPDQPTGLHGSRALELVLDAQTHSAHVAWQYHASPEIYAPFVGTARRLPNGNTVVGFGLPEGFAGLATGPIKTVEVTPAGGEVGSFTLSGMTWAYRGEPMAAIAGERTVP